jgi:hypothetical protein
MTTYFQLNETTISKINEIIHSKNKYRLKQSSKRFKLNINETKNIYVNRYAYNAILNNIDKDDEEWSY